ncbi:MAG TPA: hypothetical protein DD473_13765 [Planctomycetaceae bacterium]|nr:hypothetical protein [Planctomycetaceae bacterium]
MKFVCWVILMIGCLSIIPESPAQEREFVIVNQDDSEHRYFESLRQRRLFALAELLCQRALNDPAIRPPFELLYRIELARTFRDHAQTVPLNDSKSLWEQAFQAVSIDRLNADRYQAEAALLEASRVEQLFWVLQLNPANTELRLQFEKSSASAIQQLQKALTVSETMSGAETIAPEVTADEIQLALGRCFLRIADWKSANASLRTQYLSLSKASLKEVHRSILSQEYYLDAQLLLLSDYRLGRQSEEFNKTAAAILSGSTSPILEQRVAEERVRYLIDQAQYSEAATLINELAKKQNLLSARLRGLRLKALAELSVQVRLKGYEELANKLIDEVRLRTSQLAAEGHAFESQLASRYLSDAIAVQTYGPELAALVNQARTAVRDGEFATARQTYEAAILSAQNSGRWEQLIQLAREVAEIYFRGQHFTEAAAQLNSIWMSSPNFPGMDQIHLLWITSLEKVYSAQPTRDKLNAYANALADHLQRYPQRETALDARWRLAELTFARRQFAEAIVEYRQIPSTHSRYFDAQNRIFQCYDYLLKTQEAANRELLSDVVSLANRFLTSVEWQRVETASQVEAILQACQFLLNFETGLHQSLPETFRELQTLFTDLKNNDARFQVEPELLAKWNRSLTINRGILLVQLGRSQEAFQLFEGADSLTSTQQEAMFLLEQLAEIESADSQTEQILGSISLRVIARLKLMPTSFTPQQANALKRYEAEAYYKIGRLSKAIPIYQELVQGLPVSDPLVSRLTALLVECNNQECLEALYTLWKKKAATTRQGELNWHRARYELANACLRTGRIEEAKKIVSVTTLLYPDAGSSELKQGYAELSRLLKNAK